MKLVMASVLVLIVLVATGQVLARIISKKFDELLDDWRF